MSDVIENLAIASPANVVVTMLQCRALSRLGTVIWQQHAVDCSDQFRQMWRTNSVKCGDRKGVTDRLAMARVIAARYVLGNAAKC